MTLSRADTSYSFKNAHAFKHCRNDNFRKQAVLSIKLIICKPWAEKRHRRSVQRSSTQSTRYTQAGLISVGCLEEEWLTRTNTGGEKVRLTRRDKITTFSLELSQLLINYKYETDYCRLLTRCGVTRRDATRRVNWILRVRGRGVICHPREKERPEISKHLSWWTIRY